LCGKLRSGWKRSAPLKLGIREPEMTCEAEFMGPGLFASTVINQKEGGSLKSHVKILRKTHSHWAITWGSGLLVPLKAKHLMRVYHIHIYVDEFF
jgi:hypothetical protein